MYFTISSLSFSLSKNRDHIGHPLDGAETKNCDEEIDGYALGDHHFDEGDCWDDDVGPDDNDSCDPGAEEEDDHTGKQGQEPPRAVKIPLKRKTPADCKVDQIAAAEAKRRRKKTLAGSRPCDPALSRVVVLVALLAIMKPNTDIELLEFLSKF